MENICGSEGWMRIAYLNMSDSTEECPAGFKQYQSGGVRACGRQSSSSGCQSVKFSSYYNYSQVCGRVVGYQYTSPDSVNKVYGTGHNDINSHYVDGVNLTRGSPCQHIWRFMCGLMASNLYLDGGKSNCPCSQGSNYKGSKKGPSYVYCHMEELCSSGGGWTRIVYLDMSDSTPNCPPNCCGLDCTNQKIMLYAVKYQVLCLVFDK